MRRKRQLSEEEKIEKKRKRQEYLKQYRKDHPEKFRSASAKWRREHKEKHNEYQKRYYRRKRDNETKAERKQRLWEESLKRRIRKFDKNIIKS